MKEMRTLMNMCNAARYEQQLQKILSFLEARQEGPFLNYFKVNINETLIRYEIECKLTCEVSAISRGPRKNVGGMAQTPCSICYEHGK